MSERGRETGRMKEGGGGREKFTLLLRWRFINKVELWELGHISTSVHSVHSVELILVLLL